ncbi:MAG: hypothetical protein ACI9EF_000802 [Pseudohongiellaceae bacterium]|jgi:hypothetical protein
MLRLFGTAGRAVMTTVLLLGTAGCGGGGGGGGGSGSSGEATPGDGPFLVKELNPSVDFFLASAHFARLITDLDGVPDSVTPLINPASLVEVDLDTGLLLPGFPAPLHEDGDLSTLVPIQFDKLTDPFTPYVALVPRNAALVLTFTQPVEPTSLSQPNAVLVLDNFGAAQPQQTFLDPTNPRRVILSAVTSLSPGWPASPLVYDNSGAPIQDLTGQLAISLSSSLRTTSGQELILPIDQPGSPGVPLWFQPGNSGLDAVVLQTDGDQISFNGFLPDLTPPRITRSVSATGTISDLSALSVSDNTLIDLPSNLANNGNGTWAGARLTVHTAQAGGGILETKYAIVASSTVANTVRYELSPDSPLAPAVSLGDSYVVSRTEFFEPIPGPLPTDPTALAAVTVDPVNHPRDPFDEQDAYNSDLRYFVAALDETGTERTDVWNPTTHTFNALPPKTSLQLTFNEPMEPSSFAAYESFAVSDGDLPPSDPGFDDMRVGRVVLGAGGRSVRFEPILVDQLDPDDSRFIGFGGTPNRHRLVLRSQPSAPDIANIISSATPNHAAQLIDLETTGIVGITDLGGRGLALPPAMIDQSDSQNFLLAPGSPGRGAFPPAIDFAIPFETIASDDPDFGVVVHRFMGTAKTGIISYPSSIAHDTVTQGIEYYDHPAQDTDLDGTIDRRFLYGPTLVELGLNVPGQLIGASAATIEHVLDNFNAPKAGAFANPNGDDFLVSMGFGLTTPLNSTFGARFQHVYRAADASPSYYDYKDSVLDLIGLAWSPAAGFLVDTTLDDMQILVGLSGIHQGKGPDIKQVNGIPSEAMSGLVQQFDCNLLEWAENCGLPELHKSLVGARASQPPQTLVVAPGTTYSMRKSNLFAPANATGTPGTFNQYLDFPSFNAGYDPTFGRDNVHSFPYDSRFPMLIEYRIEDNENMPSQLNRFGFSPGIMSSVLPRFRVWSQGQNPLTHSVPNYSRFAGTPSGGPLQAGEGGPLVFPGTVLGPVMAPELNNGMPDIPVPPPYILPPVAENGSPGQPIPDWKPGNIDTDPNSATLGCITKLPVSNSDPMMNTYFANGMLANPLPNLTAYPGPQAFSPTIWAGYGVPLIATGPAGSPCVVPSTLAGPNTPLGINVEPGINVKPGYFGDNARYYMMWKYAKRVSLVQSPTITVNAPSGSVRWHRPIIDPPLSSVDPAADLKVEIRASSEIDFANPIVDSDYIDVQTSDIDYALNGPAANRLSVKFRASFGVAPGQLRPPSLHTVVLPYEKVDP